MKELPKKIVEEQRRIAHAVSNFVDGARGGDGDQMWRSMKSLLLDGAARKAFLKISKIQDIPDKSRAVFLEMFLDYGDQMRQEISDDLVYLAGLRSLMPRYDGPPVFLYRGEAMFNRKHRTYGWSWSSSREVARRFAELSMTRVGTGGNVLLSTLAPSEAIISAPCQISDRYIEDEFVVDRRFLEKVQIEERFPQLTNDEYFLQTAANPEH